MRVRSLVGRLLLCLAPTAAAIGAAGMPGIGPPSAGASAAPACTTPDLVVWLDTRASGAAGSSYYELRVTNLGARACTLRGYPGVSAVDLGGRQIGAPAARNPGQPTPVVRLAPGGTASATLRILQAANYPPRLCRPTTAAGLRVYPPGRRASRIVPFPFPTCRRPSARVLGVAPVTT